MINSALSDSNQLSRVVKKLLSRARPIRCYPRVKIQTVLSPYLFVQKEDIIAMIFDGQHEQLKIVNLQSASVVTPNTSSR